MQLASHVIDDDVLSSLIGQLRYPSKYTVYFSSSEGILVYVCMVFQIRSSPNNTSTCTTVCY